MVKFVGGGCNSIFVYTDMGVSVGVLPDVVFRVSDCLQVIILVFVV
jgi:hypothetical protein